MITKSEISTGYLFSLENKGPDNGFDPQQARDDHGMWSSGGGSGVGSAGGSGANASEKNKYTDELKKFFPGAEVVLREKKGTGGYNMSINTSDGKKYAGLHGVFDAGEGNLNPFQVNHILMTSATSVNVDVSVPMWDIGGTGDDREGTYTPAFKSKKEADKIWARRDEINKAVVKINKDNKESKEKLGGFNHIKTLVGERSKGTFTLSYLGPKKKVKILEEKF